MITGSPASVHDSDAWVSRLEGIIREIYASGVPMFGACFGHQAIAKALGGKVENNPGGWVFGVAKAKVTGRPAWATDLPATLTQYAAHVEQVTALPAGAEIILTSDACPAGGFAISNRVYTTQNHPEMSHDFITALVAEYSDKLPPDVAQTAQNSLSSRADTLAYAQSIARFFEQTA
jgi:GMP synthase-like glutamine amidotransferase